MDNAPQYLQLFVRKDGEVFGIFSHGGKIPRFQSVFPSDLFSYGRMHNSIEEAMAYLASQWAELTTSDPATFCNQVFNQALFAPANC